MFHKFNGFRICKIIVVPNSRKEPSLGVFTLALSPSSKAMDCRPTNYRKDAKIVEMMQD
jgi:hypothetical protein